MPKKKGSNITGPIRCRNTRSASITISALNAAAEEDLEITDADAEVGDVISVSIDNAGMETGVGVLAAWVSAAGTIKVRITNASGSSLTGSTTTAYYTITR